MMLEFLFFLIFLGGGILFVIIGIMNFKFSSILKERYAIPDNIIFEDLVKRKQVKKLKFKSLVSEEYRLVGKPDYIVYDNGSYIPIEIKSRIHSSAPFENHILQLAAYCLLVEQRYKKPVPFGILQYANGVPHVIPFTEELKQRLLKIIEEINMNKLRKLIERNHNSSLKCLGCSVRHGCEYKLA